jgi:hypothetical protein
MIIGNVMIPTLAGHIVVLLALLAPISMIEAVVLTWMCRTTLWPTIGLSLGANFRSTLVGVPLGYLLALAGIIPAGLFSGLLPKHLGVPIGHVLGGAIAIGGTIPNRYDELGYAVGTLLVMIPYFFVTRRVERKYILAHRPNLDPPLVARAVNRMNLITYALLAVPVVWKTVQAVTKLTG